MAIAGGGVRHLLWRWGIAVLVSIARRPGWPAVASAGLTAGAAEKYDIRSHHLGGVILLVFLVRPLARLQPALDEALPALGQVLPAQLAKLSPDDDAVPLGAFLLLPRFV